MMNCQPGGLRTGYYLAIAPRPTLGLGGVPFFTLGVFLKPLSEAFGWSRAELRATSMCLSIGAGLSAPFIGRLADRLDLRRIALLSLVAMSVAFLGLTQLNGDIRMLYLGIVLLALFGCGTSPLIWAYAVTTWFDDARGLAVGLTLDTEQEGDRVEFPL